MIFGIGIDVTSIARVDSSLQRFGERFAHRVLHENERDDFVASSQPARFLAKRFAAKEAASKALGTGIRGGVTLHDFVTWKSDMGKPELKVFGVAAERCRQVGVTRYHVSLSDEGDIVTAVAIFEM